MVCKIQKWGNSQGLRFTKSLLEEARLDPDAEVEVTAEPGRIIVQPSRRVRGRYKLEDLVRQMPSDYETKEENGGAPVGREAW